MDAILERLSTSLFRAYETKLNSKKKPEQTIWHMFPLNFFGQGGGIERLNT